MAKRRALLFLNPNASRAAGAEPALARLAEAGIDLVRVDAPDGAAMTAAMRHHRNSADLVVVAGGDGTLNAAARGLAETGLPLGILPLGTANDLARTLAIPPDPAAAAELIVAGHLRPIDLGEVNGHPFFNVASIGLGTAVAEELSAEVKARWGVLGYAVAAVAVIRRARPFGIVIEHDGIAEEGSTLHVAVGNGRFYGGGMVVAEDAEPDDGRLDVYSLEIVNRLELVALAPALRRGTHGRWRRVRAFGTAALTIRTRRPRPVNVDGEILTRTPARFSIRPAAIRVYCAAAKPEAPA